jgi:hypothetical protein
VPDPDALAKISDRMAIASLAGSVDYSPEFVTQTNSPKGSSPSEPGPLHVPIVPMRVKAPVVALTAYIETLFEPEFAT